MPPPLTEAELHAFVARLDTFAAGLTPGERHFLTTILLQACTGGPVSIVGHGSHTDSELHARLAYALWASTRAAGAAISPNPLPVPREGR